MTPFSCAASRPETSCLSKESLVDGNRSPRDAFRERFPFDQLHHQEVHALRVFETVKRRDVGMVQRREKAGFTREPRDLL